MHCNALHWPEWICSSQALSVPRGQKPSVTTIIITGGTLAKRNCHQMSPVVISCHQMSSDVVGGHQSQMIRCHQVDLLYSWSVWYSTVKSHHHHHHRWDTGQEKLSVMSSWCMGLSKYIKCSWIMIMIKSHQYQRRSIISNVNTL